VHWRFNERVIAVSEASARFHRRFNLVSPSRLDVIPNFVETGPASPGWREAVRDEMGVPRGALLVGAVGELSRAKGQDVLVEAFSRVPGAPWLLLVGDGPDRRRLEALARRLRVSDRVVFAGYRADVPRVLAAMDVFASASHEESLGMSVLEAMAAGLPVVATRVGGLAECVSHGETGLLVPPRSVTKLASAVDFLAADAERRARTGAAGRVRAERLFSAEALAPRIEASLERAVKDYANGRSTGQEART
jgi:glycosyltransferase involved in cell wall biosynthesis